MTAALAASAFGIATAAAQSSATTSSSSPPAQTSTAGSGSTQKAQEAPEPGSPEREFIRQAANTNYREVALARLAEKQADNQQVRELAQQIVRDHGQATQRLNQLAQAQGLDLRVEGSGSLQDPAAPRTDIGDVPPRVPGPGAPIPAARNPGYGGFGSIGTPGEQDEGAISAEDYRELADASGREFDQRFVELMEQSHERALRNFRIAAEELDDAQLKAFAKQQVPVLEKHLEHTRRVQTAVAE